MIVIIFWRNVKYVKQLKQLQSEYREYENEILKLNDLPKQIQNRKETMKLIRKERLQQLNTPRSQINSVLSPRTLQRGMSKKSSIKYQTLPKTSDLGSGQYYKLGTRRLEEPTIFPQIPALVQPITPQPLPSANSPNYTISQSLATHDTVFDPEKIATTGSNYENNFTPSLNLPPAPKIQIDDSDRNSLFSDHSIGLYQPGKIVLDSIKSNKN